MAYLTYHPRNPMVKTDPANPRPRAAYVDDAGYVRAVRTDYVCEAAVSYTEAGQTYYLRIPETQCPKSRTYYTNNAVSERYYTKACDFAEIVRVARGALKTLEALGWLEFVNGPVEIVNGLQEARELSGRNTDPFVGAICHIRDLCNTVLEYRDCDGKRVYDCGYCQSCSCIPDRD